MKEIKILLALLLTIQNIIALTPNVKAISVNNYVVEKPIEELLNWRGNLLEVMAEDSEVETPTEDSEVETPTEDSEVETPTEDSEVETPTEDSEVETPTEDSEVETPTEDSEVETPTEDSEVETPTEDSKVETPTEDSKVETPTEDSEVEIPTEDNLSIEEQEFVESNTIEAKNSGSGLVQLWFEVVPGQGSKEGLSEYEVRTGVWNACPVNHDLLSTQSNQSSTYVNSCYVDDVLFLGDNGDYYNIYVSGYEGKVAKYQEKSVNLDLNGDKKSASYTVKLTATFIPAGVQTLSINQDDSQIDSLFEYSSQTLNKFEEISEESISTYSSSTVQSPSYYINKDGVLYHYASKNVTVANRYQSPILVGKAPNWMAKNTIYYSYDGIYFYSHWSNVRVNGSGAVNQSNPFYNYYQYIPVRSKSNLDATDFDTFANQNVSGTNSKLLNSGRYFYNVQDGYGINSALQYAMAIHESGWGKSSISQSKNNLFGMAAFDASPGASALTFSTVEEGINYHAKHYLSWGYTDPLTDSRYFGSHIGNKGSGMNVKYASDPFWGEKIAGWYYRLDKNTGLKDYNYYSIGIKQDASVYNVLNRPNGSTLYKTQHRHLIGSKEVFYNIKHYPFLILSEGNGYYMIQSDTPIVNGVANYSGDYNWDKSIGYISQNAIITNTINHRNYKMPSSMRNKYIEFVTRLYQIGLNRNPDASGLEDWVNKLLTKEISASELIRYMVDCQEFHNRNLSTEEYVEVVYKLVLNRSADANGKTYWIEKLNSGLTRDYLIVNAVNSEEFTKYCNENGIYRTSLTYLNVLDQNENVTAYVNNFYKTAMNRLADTGGLTQWVTQLVHSQISATQFALIGLTGEEITNRKLSNEQFVDILYKTLLMRNPDADGKKYWINILNNGTSRQSVIQSATSSLEFAEICNKLGIRVN